jgi:hypothetical protein
MKYLRCLLSLLFLLAALPVPAIRAEGGIAVKPYWTFPTDSPVTHVQTGDINGDGTPEVVITTADKWLYVVENDGRLAWRYELVTVINDLRIADLDGDKQTAEIYVAGKTADVLLNHAGKPLSSRTFPEILATLALFAANLDEDQADELLAANMEGGVFVVDSAKVRDVTGFTNIYMIQPALGLSSGDVDGDGRLEIVPSPAGGSELYLLEENVKIVWQRSIEGEVVMAQAGDVDGDGLAEVIALNDSWNLFLLEGNGQQVWQQPVLAAGQAITEPKFGQLLIQDLDGNGQAEVIVLASTTIYTFDGQGRRLWQQPLSLSPMLGSPGQTSEVSKTAEVSNIPRQASTLTASDLDGDGQAELLAAIPGQETVYLLGPQGRIQAEYHSKNITGVIDYVDLNSDDWGEIIVGTETGLQVFGGSNQSERQEIWQSSPFGFATALHFADMDSDGQGEVIVGSKAGRIYILANDGHILAEVDLGEGEDIYEMFIPALDTGDIDGDDLSEIIVATFGGVSAFIGGLQVYVVDDNRPRWTAPVKGSFLDGLTVHDLNSDGRDEIIVAADFGSGSMITLLDGQGKILWEWESTELVTALGNMEGYILAGSGSGRVFCLTATGELAREYNLGAEVLAFGEGVAVTAKGQLYQLGPGEPTVIRELGPVPQQLRVSTETIAIVTKDREVNLITQDGSRWQGLVDSKIVSLATGDINNDGEVEVAVSIDQGYVYLFGLVANQPPLLTKPDLTEVRTGYAYSVTVTDPEADPVTVTVEIWDPSAGLWLAGATQSFSQNQGRLNLEIADPFDTWDSGQESRFRFRYDDGANQGVLKEVAGPFTIPTLPWYIYYGQWVGLGALIMLPVALGWVFYRRQQVYRRSPLGRAESLLKQLRAQPSDALLRLRDLARDEPALLAYLPGLAREAGETSLADLSEGFQLILTRPEVAVEGLRVLVGKTGVQSEALPEAGGVGEWRSAGAGEAGVQSQALLRSQGAQEQGSRGDGIQASIVNRQSEIQNLYALCLEALTANTVSIIVSLQARLADPKDSPVVTTLVVPTITTTTRGPSAQVVTTTESPLAELSRVAQMLHNYERVETVEDKVAYLAQAIEMLGRLDREFQTTLAQPERNIFSRIAFNWLAVAANALEDLQGRAQIEASLKTRQVLSLEQTTLSLELTNIGRSPASNVTISLNQDQYFAVGNGTAQLDILPAGRSVLVELPVSAAASVEQFRAEFTITFDDRERSGKQVAFADLVRLLKPGLTFQKAPNPYAPGTPLRPSSPIFFGRDDLFQFMTENMSGPTRQNILVLIGQRRMGKTSFLQQLPARLGPDYLPIYLDGQSLGIDPGMANFFYDLSLAIAEALAEQGCAITEPELAAFQERPSGVFERTFLPAVFAAIGSRRLLLLFDEFEELEMRVVSGKLEATIFPFFRHLMQHADKLGFVFVGTHRLEELSADYWSILFNIALYKRVTFLNEAAAKALIVEPVAQAGLLYDDLALDKMIRVTAGHPYFLQLICHALVNRANRESRGYLTIRHVNDTLAELVELGEAHFAFLWEQSTPAEQLILAALMRLLAKTPTVTASQIGELLAERGRPLELQAVREALRRLTERDIVRELGESPPHYDYKVDLIRLWVERYKALSRVIEEMDK